MIQANELRIGATFINNSDGLFEDGEYVTLDRHHFYWAFESSQNLEDLLLPIRLTPERLILCGFEENKKSNGCAYLKDGFELWKGDGRDYFNYSVIGRNDDGINEPDINLEYLHQLQNLIFPLTGKELEIKELQHA